MHSSWKTNTVIIVSISKKENPPSFQNHWSKVKLLHSFPNAYNEPGTGKGTKDMKGNESDRMPFSGTCPQRTHSLVEQTER